MPDPGVLLSKELALELKALAEEARANPPPATTGERLLRDLSHRPPIRAILLSDLASEGSADAALTTPQTTNEVQVVEIIGNPVTGGTFTLAFRGQTTAPLAFNATAAQVQSALQGLSTIGTNNCKVALGKGSYTNRGSGKQTTEFPGVWLVQFVGALAAQTNLPLLVPTPQVGGLQGGPAVIASALTQWTDSGIVETVKAVIPVGTPSPMHAGAVVCCVFFPGFGYGVIACEARQFAVTYY